MELKHTPHINLAYEVGIHGSLYSAAFIPCLKLLNPHKKYSQL